MVSWSPSVSSSHLVPAEVVPEAAGVDSVPRRGLGGAPVTGGRGIGAKPNLYCEAIELVCGGSSKICVLVEWKALDRVKSKL